ncbi:MAG: hypothetical protein HFI08_06615 [Bacilli bacterium]|nr:hypothetical protein [Bacilli bacterium]
MPIQINTIITLDNQMRYVVLNETEYMNHNYFLVMEIDQFKEVIPTNVAILESIIEGQDTYVEKVTDPELMLTLTNILKAQV